MKKTAVLLSILLILALCSCGNNNLPRRKDSTDISNEGQTDNVLQSYSAIVKLRFYTNEAENVISLTLDEDFKVVTFEKSGVAFEAEENVIDDFPAENYVGGEVSQITDSLFTKLINDVILLNPATIIVDITDHRLSDYSLANLFSSLTTSIQNANERATYQIPIFDVTCRLKGELYTGMPSEDESEDVEGEDEPAEEVKEDKKEDKKSESKEKTTEKSDKTVKEEKKEEVKEEAPENDVKEEVKEETEE